MLTLTSGLVSWTDWFPSCHMPQFSCPPSLSRNGGKLLLRRTPSLRRVLTGSVSWTYRCFLTPWPKNSWACADMQRWQGDGHYRRWMDWSPPLLNIRVPHRLAIIDPFVCSHSHTEWGVHSLSSAASSPVGHSRRGLSREHATPNRILSVVWIAAEGWTSSPVHRPHHRPHCWLREGL